jgi:tetratricopeptide (TPR) repeat protein
MLEKWLANRNLRDLWIGLPSLIFFLAAIVGYVYRSQWSDLKVHDRFAFAKTASLAARSFAGARVACERLLEISSRNPVFGNRRSEHTFDLATSLTGLERFDSAEHLIRKVAPLDDKSFIAYPPALLHMAKTTWLLARDKTPEVKAAYERYLLRAATDDPEMDEARRLLGEFYLQEKNWNKARQYLLGLADRSGDCMLPLAFVSKGLGDSEGTRQWAGRATQFFKPRTENSVQEDTSARIGYSQSLVLLGQFDGAIENFITGLKRTGDQRYAAAAATIYADWIESLRTKEGELSEEILGHVRKGLEYDPSNRRLLDELIRIQNSNGPSAVAATGMINDLIARGGDNGVLHFALGAAALRNNDSALAKTHLDLAFRQQPTAPLVAVHFARAIILEEEPPVDYAMELTESVLARQPDLPIARETKGRIFLLMGRYTDAVTELSAALPRMGPDSPATHRSLAFAYRALNLPDLAARHDEMSGNSAPIP